MFFKQRRSVTVYLFGGIALAGVILAVAVAVYCYVERSSGREKLRAVQRELSEAGLLRSLSELTPQGSPEAKDNARKLLHVISALKDLRKISPIIREGSELMTYTAPGLVIPIVRKDSPSHRDGVQGDAKKWVQIREQFQPGAHIVAQAGKLLSEPIALEYDYTFPGGAIQIGEMQDLLAWLRVAAAMKLREGDARAAIDHLDAIVRISESVGEIGTLVMRVLGMGMWTFGSNDLCWEILQTESLNDADLRRLQEIVSRGNFVESARRAVAVEAAMIASSYSWLQKAPSLGSLFDTSPSDGILGSPPGLFVRNRLWSFVWADADQAKALLNLGEEVRLGNELIQHRNAQILLETKSFESQPVYDLWRYPMMFTLFEAGTGRAVYRSAIRVETRRQMVVAAIALERYRLANNDEYPSSLEKLVPAYLFAVPHDWSDGQSLKYKRLDGKQFLLYSVGKDGVDDGGDVTFSQETTRPQMDSGRDLVWPRPVKKSTSVDLTSPTAALRP